MCFVISCFIKPSTELLNRYVANLWIASRIKKIVGDNEAARTYFQARSFIFTFFVVCTGGAYPALALCSSNIFGLSVFNSGLTRFGLRKLTKIKVFNSVLLENGVFPDNSRTAT